MFFPSIWPTLHVLTSHNMCVREPIQMRFIVQNSVRCDCVIHCRLLAKNGFVRQSLLSKWREFRLGHGFGWMSQRRHVVFSNKCLLCRSIIEGYFRIISSMLAEFLRLESIRFDSFSQTNESFESCRWFGSAIYGALTERASPPPLVQNNLGRKENLQWRQQLDEWSVKSSYSDDLWLVSFT